MKRISLAAALVLACAAHAGWVEDQIAEDRTNARITHSPSGATYIDGGSVRYRFNQGVEPGPFISARAPKVSGGCNGIDMDFGGLQFNGAALIEKLKKILGAAEGYAFQIAMKTFCPQCADVLEFLDALARAANAMDLDSCGIAKASVDALAGAASNFAQANGIEVGGASTPSFHSQMSTWTESLNKFADQGGLDNIIKGLLKNSPIEPGESLVHKTYMKLSDTLGANTAKMGFATDQQAESFLANLWGDVIVYGNKDTSELSAKMINSKGALWFTSSVSKALAEGYNENLDGFNFYGKRDYDKSTYATKEPQISQTTCTMNVTYSTVADQIKTIRSYVQSSSGSSVEAINAMQQISGYEVYSIARYANASNYEIDAIARHIQRDKLRIFLTFFNSQYHKIATDLMNKYIANDKLNDTVKTAFKQIKENAQSANTALEFATSAEGQLADEDDTKVYNACLQKARENRAKTYREGLAYLQKKSWL